MALVARNSRISHRVRTHRQVENGVGPPDAEQTGGPVSSHEFWAGSAASLAQSERRSDASYPLEGGNAIPLLT
jgi:hypothetical protein